MNMGLPHNNVAKHRLIVIFGLVELKLIKYFQFKSYYADIKLVMSTIFALSSGLGKCGVAVLRISGSGAKSALQRMTKSPLPKPREAALRTIVHPDDRVNKRRVLTFCGLP